MQGVYIELGFEHILDSNGYDHILFVVALSAGYLLKDWRKVVVLVTAFTIGHSLTLALSSLDVITISSSLVETLIPVTIILTCIVNILLDGKTGKNSVHGNYGLALGFGLIHGLGFSNFFKALMGMEENIIGPLFSFNIGVELGQIVIVLLTLLLSFLVVDLFKLKQRNYNYFISSVILIWAIYLLVDLHS